MVTDLKSERINVRVKKNLDLGRNCKSVRRKRVGDREEIFVTQEMRISKWMRKLARCSTACEISINICMCRKEELWIGFARKVAKLSSRCKRLRNTEHTPEEYTEISNWLISASANKSPSIPSLNMCTTRRAQILRYPKGQCERKKPRKFRV